jgi:hypothetical protein
MTPEIPSQPTAKAVQACAQWLQACLSFGWRKQDLDVLEALWWKYHDHRGELQRTEVTL